MSNTIFSAFDNGTLRLPSTTVKFADIPWSKHPDFDGVELKHIVTANETADSSAITLSASHQIKGLKTISTRRSWKPMRSSRVQASVSMTVPPFLMTQASSLSSRQACRTK